MLSKFSAALIFSLLSSTIIAANPKYYLSLNAVKDGNLYHNNITSFTNVIPILGFNFSATASRDVASGLPTGHSTYTPITLYKEMDISSPLLMQILTTNEAFQAQITAVESATEGHLDTTIVWKLTNGALDGVTYRAGETRLVEIIALVFERLEIDATAGGTTVSTIVDTLSFTGAA